MGDIEGLLKTGVKCSKNRGLKLNDERFDEWGNSVWEVFKVNFSQY